MTADVQDEAHGTLAANAAEAGTGLAPRRIAVVPAFNEEPTVYAVLAALNDHPCVDEIVIVDDGSTDGTRAEIQRFIDERHGRVQMLTFDRNRGMSAAYAAAFGAIGERIERGDLKRDDLLLTVDADGQHDPALLDRLIQVVIDEDLAALVAERDLKGSGYTRYKRAGNWLMSAWATLWAGRRWRDVESGFRIFRAGPLIDALDYYRGYKYSETVEVAVILCRLGYKVRNDVTIPVPIFRSRTRLYDVVVDLLAMPAAWWRVTVGRSAPPGIGRRTAYWLPLIAFAALAIILLLVASKRIFLGNDSINNYVYAWLLREQIFGDAAISLHAAPLDGGHASPLPYGGVPWLTAAVLSTMLGEWAVTWLFVVGLIALTWAATVARRAMRDPWFLLLFVLNPFFIDALFSFQFSFVWSAAFFFLYVAMLDKRRWLLAGITGWLAAGTHPIMGLPPVALYLGWSVWRGRTPLPRAVALAAVVGVALIPLLILTLQAPAIGENSVETIALSIADVVVRRGTILLVPFVFARYAETLRLRWRPVAGIVTAGLVVNTVFANGFLGFAEGGYSGIVTVSRNHYEPFIESGAFERGAHYRVLTPNDREDGIYYLMRQGAVLTSDLFTESMFKRNFEPDQYTCFLAAKDVDFVVMERGYERQYRTNEARLLGDLSDRGLAHPVLAGPSGRYTVYDVRPARLEAQSPPPGVRSCLGRPRHRS